MKRLKGTRKAEVVFWDEESCTVAPREARIGAAFWASWVYEHFDPKALAKEASRALARIAPYVRPLAVTI